ncbi:MAG: helix-turn-helix transcriptional regulator [Candidatus Saccharimonadales bacterium]
MTENILPFSSLGTRLKAIREKLRESLSEVSGAVEIDEKDLELIETGRDRPSEDVLMLLISHFKIRDSAAAELWQLAGYDKANNSDDSTPTGAKNTLMVMIDPRIMYSDNIEVLANQQGVVLNFSQTNGGPGQMLTIAKIGMSKDQAKTVMGVLHQTLYEMDNPSIRRQLPPPKNSSDQK